MGDDDRQPRRLGRAGAAVSASSSKKLPRQEWRDPPRQKGQACGHCHICTGPATALWARAASRSPPPRKTRATPSSIEAAAARVTAHRLNCNGADQVQHSRGTGTTAKHMHWDCGTSHRPTATGLMEVAAPRHMSRDRSQTQAPKWPRGTSRGRLTTAPGPGRRASTRCSPPAARTTGCGTGSPPARTQRAAGAPGRPRRR